MKKLIVCALVVASVGLSAQTGVLTLKKAYWQMIAAKNVKLSNLSVGALVFDFPTDSPNGQIRSANYLYGGRPPLDMSGVTLLTITASIYSTVTPTFVFQWPGDGNVCPGQAEGSPFFWAHNQGGGEFDRWWSHAPYHFYLDQIVNHPIELSVPINAAEWTSVYGRSGTDSPESATGWQSAISDVTDIGITFGGGCFYGHGVALTAGNAQFRLHDYRFQ